MLERLISDGFWQRRFARDPSALGRAIVLDRTARTIVGILPRDFSFPFAEPADVFVPMGFTALEQQGRGPSLTKSVIARLKPGVSIDAARAEANALTDRVAERFPIAVRSVTLSVQPLKDEVTGGLNRILLLLSAAVGLVLLIACANVANLTLTRAAGRRREMAIRSALGAGRGVLLEQMLLESATLAFGAAIVGLLTARWLVLLLVRYAPVALPRAGEIQSDPLVLGFTAACSVVTAILVGLLPAIQSSRASELKEGGRGTTAGRSRGSLLGSLVTAQFALTLVLVIAGGLMLRSLGRVLAVDPGFRPEQSVAVTTSLPSSVYGKAQTIRAMYRRVVEQAETMPGIRAAGVGTDLPLGDWEKRSFTIDGDGARNVQPPASHVWITGHYFEALGVALKSGRFFNDAEYRETRNVVIVSESTARAYWPGMDPIGRRMSFGPGFGWLTVVGIVSDIKQTTLDTPATPQTFEPHTQIPDRILEMPTIPFVRALNLVARSSADVTSSLRTMQSVIHTTDPALAISASRPLDQVIAESTRAARFSSFLVSGFGGIALLLAMLGIGGVLGYVVSQRTTEIGIRLALGATPEGVSRMIVRRGVRMAVAGIVIGLVAALAASRLIARFLYGVSPNDAVTYIAVPALMIAVAVIASWLPARRAARVDPLISIRNE